MNVLVLRSYGDYIVLLNAIKYSTQSQSIKIIVSKHLKPLHEALHLDLPNNYTFEFINLNIQRGLLGIFTNKYFLNFNSVKEIVTLRKYLKTKKISSLYLEQDKRIRFLKLITGTHLQAIYHNNNIYESFENFFASKNTSKLNYWNKDIQEPKIIIFPDSRKKDKKINKKTLLHLLELFSVKNIYPTIASFNQNLVLDDRKGNQISYHNFVELVALIQMADFIISSDSLPIHLSEILHKPHWTLYNQKINNNWLTPSSKHMKFYSTFDEIDSIQLIFN